VVAKNKEKKYKHAYIYTMKYNKQTNIDIVLGKITI